MTAHLPDFGAECFVLHHQDYQRRDTTAYVGVHPHPRVVSRDLVHAVALSTWRSDAVDGGDDGDGGALIDPPGHDPCACFYDSFLHDFLLTTSQILPASSHLLEEVRQMTVASNDCSLVIICR